MKKTLIFYVEFTKNLILFSLFTPRFFIRKFINVVKLFLREGGINSLKQTYLEGDGGGGGGGTCKMNRDKQGERELKIRNFERTYFAYSECPLS